MGLYEILKASKLGAGAAPDMYTALFAQKIKGGGEAELSGVPPLTFRSNGTPLLDYIISGNTTQSGTPTPDNPIMPEGCGEMTANLWTLFPTQTYRGVSFEFTNNTIKMNNICTQEGNIGDTINLKAGTYTIAANANINISQNTHILQIYKANVVSETLSLSDMISGKATFTITEDTTDILIRIHVMNGVDYSGLEIQPMLNLGSTALLYEPPGFKLDISSGGENLWDEEYTDISSTAIYRPLLVGDGTFTLSTNFQLFNSATDIFLLPGIASSGINSSTNGAYDGKSITATSVGGYVTIAYRKYARPSSGAITECKTMLNRGSTALPYSPYNRTTTSIYLGEVPTTRLIKKLVLDGTENVVYNARNDNRGRFAVTVGIPITGTSVPYNVISSHLPTLNSVDVILLQTGICMRSTATDVVIAMAYGEVGITSPTDALTITTAVKSYLAQQYAAGTPVTIWYVLNASENAVVNEQLMKISTYADTLSKEQAGANIPTNDGSTTVDVDTTVKPSEVYIKYMGV